MNPPPAFSKAFIAKTCDKDSANQIMNEEDWYGEEIFRAGLAKKPENPYFVTKVAQNREGDLFVPIEVIKRFDLEFPMEMKLMDPPGREFQGKCKTREDGMTLISRGWRDMCKMNLVAQDDECICEFVRGEDTRSRLMKVSFVRWDAVLKNELDS